MMKIRLLCVGKTSHSFVKEGMEKYNKRIKKYLSFHTEILPEAKTSKNTSPGQIKHLEAEKIKKKIDPADLVILLDENGKQFTSVDFAHFLEKQFSGSKKQVVFIVGGAYGFSDEIYQMAHHKIALSPMTFSHQIIRVIFMEQLYRALTIIKGEPYHNE